MKHSSKVYVTILFFIIAFVLILSFFGFGCQKTNEKIETVKTWVYFEAVVDEITEDGENSYAWVHKGTDAYHLYKIFFSPKKRLKEGMRIIVKADTVGKKSPYHLYLAWVK